MYKLEVHSNRNNSGWDISQLAYDIQYTTSLDGNPGKLTFSLKKDPTGGLFLECGYCVTFQIITNEITENVFTGYIFTMSTGRKDNYKITAYDSLRYLKNHDSFVLKDGEKSLNEVFEEICRSWKIKYKNELIELGDLSDFALPQHVFNDVTLFDILSWCMQRTETGDFSIFKGNSLIAQTIKGNKEYDAGLDDGYFGRKYFLKDKNGILTLTEVALEGQNNPVIIGTESLLTDYQYELSIDKDTYNDITLVQDSKVENEGGKKKSKRKQAVAEKADEETIKRWGRLNKTITIKEGANQQQIEEYVNLTLQNYNRITKTLKLNAIGYSLYAGSSFILDLEKIGMTCRCYVLTATHNYKANIHTMTLEVTTNPKLLEVL